MGDILEYITKGYKELRRFFSPELGKVDDATKQIMNSKKPSKKLNGGALEYLKSLKK